MSRGHRKGPQKPRLELDFDDTRNGSILIKRVVRNAEGRPVESILPRRAGYGSTSESSSSDSYMGKRKDSRRERDRSGERRDKKKRRRNDKKRDEAPQSSAVYKNLARGFKPPPKDHDKRKHRDEKNQSRKPSTSNRKSDDSEEEAPPDRHHGASTSKKHKKIALKTEAPLQKGISCGTSMTPFRFDPANDRTRNFSEGRINLTLNVCGVPAAPTIVEKTSGITIQCNHPEHVCGRSHVHQYATDTLPALTDSLHRTEALLQHERHAAPHRRTPQESMAAPHRRTPQDSTRESLVPYSDDSEESCPEQEEHNPDSGKENRETPIRIPSEKPSSFASPRRDPESDIHEGEVMASFAALKEELSQSQNRSVVLRGSAPTLNSDRNAFAVAKRKHGLSQEHPDYNLERWRIATPCGPSRIPYEITKSLPTTSRRNTADLPLESSAASTSLRTVMMEAYMNDCLASLSSQNTQRAAEEMQQSSDRVNFFPTEATIGEGSSHGRHCNPSSIRSRGSQRNSELEASLEQHLVIGEVQTLANELISARNPNFADRRSARSQQSRANRVVDDERLSQRNLVRRPGRSDLVDDSVREASRIPPSETESLHLPVVITDRKRASRQQLVEVQVKDKNVNRARKSSCFDPVDRGPPIPDILVDLVQNAHKDHYQEITIDDVRKARLVGQFDRSFLALSKDSDGSTLLLIDQHAVHERILLEKLEDECFRNTDRPTPTVILAPAIVIKLEDPAQMHLVRRDARMMEGHGFLVKILQNEAISIQTAPRCVSTKDVERLRRTTVSLFQEFIRGSETFSSLFHRVLKSKACHSAIKCPKELDKATQERLIQDMLKCRLPFQCCHGRPSINPISSNTLRVFTQDHASQNALWNKIKVNVDMQLLDKTPPTEP